MEPLKLARKHATTGKMVAKLLILVTPNIVTQPTMIDDAQSN